MSALASLGIVAAGTAALVFGLAGRMPLVKSATETLVSLATPPEEPPPPPPRRTRPTPTTRTSAKPEASRPKDAASPENLRNQASAVFAPVLPPLRTPPPIIAAPRPGVGDAANTGASDRIGPGQGAGGVGDGTGGGGNGGGGNGDGDAVTRPIQIKGKLYWSDLPAELREAKRGGELELRYTVTPQGRVVDCRVTKSSGLSALDAQTCRLITQRFRFRPARNAAGQPVTSGIEETHGWYAYPEGEPDFQGD